MLKQTFTVISMNMIWYVAFTACAVTAGFLNHYSGGISLILLVLLMSGVQNLLVRNMSFMQAAENRKRLLCINVIKFLFLIIISIFFASIFNAVIVANGYDKNIYLITLIRLNLVLMLTMVFSLFGTWLPAGLHGINTSLAHAFRRGRTRFFSTGFRVLLGTAFPFIVLSLSSLERLAMGRSLHVPLVMLIVVFNISQAFSCTYISVVLVRRYMEAENIGLPSPELVEVFT